MKEFFKGVHPNKHGGWMYLKVKVSYSCSVKDFKGNTKWFHTEAKEMFWESGIQAFEQMRSFRPNNKLNMR